MPTSVHGASFMFAARHKLGRLSFLQALLVATQLACICLHQSPLSPPMAGIEAYHAVWSWLPYRVHIPGATVAKTVYFKKN